MCTSETRMACSTWYAAHGENNLPKSKNAEKAPVSSQSRRDTIANADVWYSSYRNFIIAYVF
jgi:hypothetical protein